MQDNPRLFELADQVMTLSRNAIVMNLRFMDMAVFRLRAEPADTTLATDGRCLFYGPAHILRRYMRDEALPARDHLHVLLHCVFRHPFIDTLVDRRLWDLAADIAVEAMIGSLALPRFEAGRELDQRPVIDALTEKLGLLTAEKLYHFFRDDPPPEIWEDVFRSDDHSLWHRARRRQEALNGRRSGGEAEDEGDSSGDSQAAAQNDEAAGDREPSPGNGEETGENSGNAADIPQAAGENSARDDSTRSLSAISEDEGESRSRSRLMRSEAGGGSGESLYRKSDDGKPQNQNVGRGLDTEGGESSTPAGSQSRNERTRGGVESSTANGTSGDSGNAATQGDSASGGSGSGQADAQVLEPGEEGKGQNDTAERADNIGADSRAELMRQWQDVSERIQIDLEAQAHQRGAQAGSLFRQLEIANREKYDYADFLRKFAVLGEYMQLNDDEFDQIFYTYGLRLYGNLPLIEPLETKEVRRIRDFVIAIDTSASTSGALVERFLSQTWEVLSSEGSFFKRIRIWILQCDAEIREEAVITCREDFERYICDFSVRGLGGTDFRPVFRRVDELLRQGEFTHLRGLIYFTDGEGIYPARKPDYETAFVFVRRPDDAAPDVPAWAIKLVLDEGDI